MCDDEAASGGNVFGLAHHDGAVHVVRVGARREDEEERSQAEEDVEQGRHRALDTLWRAATMPAIGGAAERGDRRRGVCVWLLKPRKPKTLLYYIPLHNCT